MKIIDLTQSFTDKMPVYPGDPEPTLKSAASLETDGYNDHLLNTVMHVGTHMDAPLHMIENGKTMDEIDPNMFFGKGVLVDAQSKSQIDSTLLDSIKIEEGSIVLIYTGYGSKYRDNSYYENYPPITEDFAKQMVDLKVKIVAMDMLAPDQPPYSTHKILLGNGILIIENLANLDQIMGVNQFDVIALPMKLQSDAAPVRVIAKIPE